MVGGLDRYFQIARCLRDEDLRADRQFEFMQLDVEMSFADQEDVLDAVSVAVLAAAEAVRPGEAPATIPRMTWHEAMERYGSDKPDMRFGMELVELDRGVRGDRVPGVRRRRGGQGHLRRRARATWRARSSTRSPTGPSRSARAGLVWMRVRDGGVLESPVVEVPVRSGAARRRRRARRGGRATSC